MEIVPWFANVPDGSKRLRPLRLETSVHGALLQKWMTSRSCTDLGQLLEPIDITVPNMSLWTRAMPKACDMVGYVDLVNLYLEEANGELLYTSKDMVQGILLLHKSWPCLFGRTPVLQSKFFAGVLATGFSRFRDLRNIEKKMACYRHASGEHKQMLDALSSRIVFKYSSLSVPLASSVPSQGSSPATPASSGPPSRSMSVVDNLEELLKEINEDIPVAPQVPPQEENTFAIVPFRSFRHSATFSGRCQPVEEADATNVASELDDLIAELGIGRYSRGMIKFYYLFRQAYSLLSFVL